jgi:hypothetical protein
MNTAVQLRPIATRDSPRSDLVYGTPCEIVPGTLGPVALFASGELVAYLLRSRRRARLFVFRTLVVDDRLAAALPGVRPRVELLLDTDSAGRSRLVQRLFAYLVNTSRDPVGLPDAFYVRVGVALAGRLPAHKILLSLLSPQPSHAEPRPGVERHDKGNDSRASLRPTTAERQGTQPGPALRTIQRKVS